MSTISPEPYLRELGRLVLNFNAAEHSFRRLLWLLIDLKDERVGQVVSDGVDLAKAAETIRALLSHRQLNAEVSAQVSDLVGRFDTLRLERNRFVHALWRVPNDAVDLRDLRAVRTPRRRTSEYQEVPESSDSATIAKAASEAAAVSELLDVAIEGVRSASMPR